MIRPLGKQTAAVLVPLLLLAACSGGGSPAADPSPSASSSADATATAAPCADVADGLVAAVQHYVDGYGDRVAGGSSDESSGQGSADQGDTALQNALSQTRDAVARRGCDIATFRTSLGRGLDGVTARGPVAKAVLLRLEVSLTGQQATTAETREAKPGDDLPRLIASLGPGSTVTLAAGTYRLDETEVLLQGVTLRGAGAGKTVLASRAGEAGILVLTDGRVELSRLTLRHDGAKAAAGVIGGPTSSVVLSDVTVSGARGGTSGGTGGAAVLMSGRDGQEAGRGTTLEVTGSRFADNAVSGVLLLGRHRASIRDSTFDTNGQCGVCFGGAARARCGTAGSPATAPGWPRSRPPGRSSPATASTAARSACRPPTRRGPR